MWTSVRATLARWSGRVDVRLFVAAVLVLLHLLAFARTGHERLGLPFNSAPGEPPFYPSEAAKYKPTLLFPMRHWSRLVVSRWDSHRFIQDATRGLDACPSDASEASDQELFLCGAGKFPAYGIVIGALAGTVDVAPDVALVVVSCLFAFAINLMWTSRRIVARLGRREAWATLLAFNLFPSAFFVVTPYSEAATFALVLGGLLLVMEERWVAGAIVVGTATALRISGFVYGLAFGLAALATSLRRRGEGRKDWWRPIAASPLAGWGVVATLVSFQMRLGTATPWNRVGHVFDHDHPPIAGRAFESSYYIRGFATQHLDTFVLVCAIAIVALCGRDVLRRLPRPAAIFVAASSALLVFVSTYATSRSDLYWGLNRYLLLAPLVFLAAGAMARKHVVLYVAWLAVSLALYWHVELCSYVTQGRPDLCPCLGRMEWWAPFAS
jgi:hypothetical protein